MEKTTKAAGNTAAANQLITNSRQITIDDLQQTLNDAQVLQETMKLIMQRKGLSAAGRRSMRGAGIRRYGFIDEVSDLAEANPKFAPAFFNSDILKDKLRKIELLRNISVALRQMLRLNDDALLIESDAAYQMALGYYNTVREASHRRQAGAQTVFKALQPFFRRKPRHSAEPTQAEVERDVRALLHGKKEGKIVIEHEKPRLIKGKRTVIDEIDKRELV